MDFKSKYHVNQEVWVMFDNKPTCTLVRGVYIECESPTEDYEVIYALKSVNSKKESLVYPTKEELIKSL